MAAGDGAQLPATVAASRSVEKALEEAASSGALILSNRKLKEFPRTAKNYDLSDITHAGKWTSKQADDEERERIDSFNVLCLSLFTCAPSAGARRHCHHHHARAEKRICYFHDRRRKLIVLAMCF